MSSLKIPPAGTRTVESPALKHVRSAISEALPQRTDLIHRAGLRGIMPLVLKEFRQGNERMLRVIAELHDKAPQFSRTSLGAYFSERALRPAFQWIEEHPESCGLGRPNKAQNALQPVHLHELSDDEVQQSATQVLHHHIRQLLRDLFTKEDEKSFDHQASEAFYRMTYPTRARDSEIFLCLGADTAVDQTFRMYRNVLPRLFYIHSSETPVAQRLEAVRGSVAAALQRLSNIPAGKFENFSGKPAAEARPDHQLFELEGSDLVISKRLPQSDIGCAGVFARIGKNNAIEAVNNWTCDIFVARAKRAEMMSMRPPRENRA